MYPSTYEITYRNEGRYWWYVARSEILTEMFRHFFHPKEDLKILNIGCGTGLISKTFLKYGRVFNLDYSMEALNFSKLRGLKDLIQAKAQALPIKDNVFDVIIVFDLLEHLDNDTLLLVELKKVLRKGGKIFLTVPAYKFIWSRIDSIARHKRRYTKKMLLKILKDAKIEIVKISYFNTLLFPFAVIERIYGKIFKSKTKGDNFLPAFGPIFNKSLRRILLLEKHILKIINFAYGLSILAIGKKVS